MPSSRGKHQFDELSSRVAGCALEAHSRLGPGRLESAYEQCLAHELHAAAIPFKPQRPLPVSYQGIRPDRGCRLDFVLDGKLVLELKSVEGLLPIREAQLLTYLKLAGIRVDLLMNFNVVRLRDGMKRMVL